MAKKAVEKTKPIERSYEELIPQTVGPPDLNSLLLRIEELETGRVEFQTARNVLGELHEKVGELREEVDLLKGVLTELMKKLAPVHPQVDIGFLRCRLLGKNPYAKAGKGNGVGV